MFLKQYFTQSSHGLVHIHCDRMRIELLSLSELRSWLKRRPYDAH